MGNSATGGNSAAWGVATATSPGMLSTTAQDVAGVKSFVDGVQGPGTVPIGCMITAMPNIDAVNAWQPPATGVIKDGFMRADGTVITASHISQGCKLALNTVLPNMIQKYPRGNTTSGATGGANTVTIASANLPAHTHGVGTLANTAEAAHTHGVGTYGNAAEAAHTHSWGGWWSNDNSTAVASPEGDGNGNTYSDNGNGVFAESYWGAGTYKAVGTGGQSNTHTHAMSTSNSSYMNQSGGWQTVGLGSDQTGGASADHTHSYYLPSHRHWIKARTSGTGSTHNHAFSGTSAAGSSHNHAISGSTDNGGFANTALNNEPAYIETIWVIRVK